MHPDQPTAPSDVPPTSSCPKRPKPYRSGRPRVLDDAKRREVCAFVAGGCELRDAAHYVNCSVNTIRREADRNPDFAEQLRNSEAHARFNPLRAMQRAMGTHWRAAAWFLERTYPERFAKRKPGVFGAREARELMNEVLRIMRDEFCDPFKANDVERRIRGAFEYHIRTNCDELRDKASLEAAMKFFDDKNRISGPWADLGMPTPEEFYRSTGPSRTSPPTSPSKSNKVDPAPAVRPKQNDRQSPQDRPRSETTPGAMPTAPRTRQTRPADNGHPPEVRRGDEVRRGSPDQVRRGSPDPAANPTVGLPPNGHSATSKSQPKSNRPQPVPPPALPSSHPDGKPSPQTAPSKTENSRGAVKRPGSPAERLEEFVHDLAKKLEARAPTSPTFESTNSKSH